MRGKYRRRAVAKLNPVPQVQPRSHTEVESGVRLILEEMTVADLYDLSIKAGLDVKKKDRKSVLVDRLMPWMLNREAAANA